MADCSDLKAAMDQLAHDLSDAEDNELGHELKTGAAVVTAGTGAGILGACLLGLIGGPAGCAGAALIAAGSGAVAGTTVAIGSNIHENQSEKRRKEIEAAHADAKAAYCACLRGDTSDLPPVPVFTPAPPEPDMTELEQWEDALQQCFAEEEEAPVCEGPDPTDQFPPSGEEEEDIDLICTGDGLLYGPGF